MTAPISLPKQAGLLSSPGWSRVSTKRCAPSPSSRPVARTSTSGGDQAEGTDEPSETPCKAVPAEQAAVHVEQAIPYKGSATPAAYAETAAATAATASVTPMPDSTDVGDCALDEFGLTYRVVGCATLPKRSQSTGWHVTVESLCIPLPTESAQLSQLVNQLQEEYGGNKKVLARYMRADLKHGRVYGAYQFENLDSSCCSDHEHLFDPQLNVHCVLPNAVLFGEAHSIRPARVLNGEYQQVSGWRKADCRLRMKSSLHLQQTPLAKQMRQRRRRTVSWRSVGSTV
jgi:hypothetical protein